MSSRASAARWMLTLPPAAIALGILTAADPALVLVACGALVVVLACAWLAAGIGPALALTLPALLAALLVPQGAELAAEAALLALALVLALGAIEGERRAAPVALAALAVLAYWTLLTLHPNVPSLSVGLLGVRKTAYVFVGLAIGALWPRGSPVHAERLVARMLCVAGIGALALHLALPGVEASYTRGASVYTEEFAGQHRMSGFFAGPFHVALLGTFLVLWAWHAHLSRAESRRVCLVMGLSGGALLAFAQVRSGYVAVAAGVGITLLLAPGPHRSRTRTVGLTVAVLSAAALLLSSNPIGDQALSSIPHLTEDTRAVSRLASWQTALGMVRASPVVGWGPGSAGATLETSFASGRHVTAHNMLLGFAVEGGLVGLALIGAVLVCLRRVAKEFGRLTHPAAAAAIALGAFGLSGDVSEALPVSFFLMILIGLRCAPESTRAGAEPLRGAGARGPARGDGDPRAPARGLAWASGADT